MPSPKAYFCASVVVLYNLESHSQRHYRNHTNDVECLSAHPTAAICATGQAEGHENTGTVQKPHVQVQRPFMLINECNYGVVKC